jgi:hypothetical protein
MEQTAKELKEATQILQNYFDAVSEFDYQKMRDQCSASFHNCKENRKLS